MPKRPCRQPGCPELVAAGYCSTHQRVVDQGYRARGYRSKQGNAYQTKRWRILRRRVLTEQPKCLGYPEGTDCGELAVEVDHVVAVEDGGAMWDRSNLVGRCKACHGRKTREELDRRVFE
jgi:5-methylcytosine-specific restriction protein A